MPLLNVKSAWLPAPSQIPPHLPLKNLLRNPPTFTGGCFREKNMMKLQNCNHQVKRGSPAGSLCFEALVRRPLTSSAEETPSCHILVRGRGQPRTEDGCRIREPTAVEHEHTGHFCWTWCNAALRSPGGSIRRDHQYAIFWLFACILAIAHFARKTLLSGWLLWSLISSSLSICHQVEQSPDVCCVLRDANRSCQSYLLL